VNLNHSLREIICAMLRAFANYLSLRFGQASSPHQTRSLSAAPSAFVKTTADRLWLKTRAKFDFFQKMEHIEKLVNLEHNEGITFYKSGKK
jgi:hypothetical protein